MKNHRGLQHFHHKSGFAPGNVVARAHPRENLVAPANLGGTGRHEAADLGHQHDERRLTQQRGFTGHIRTGQQDNLLAGAVEHHVVGNILFTALHQGFDDGMATVLDIDAAARIHDRPTITVSFGKIRKRGQQIQSGQNPAVGLDFHDFRLDFPDQLIVNPCFQHIDFLFRTQNLLFVVLEFFGNITLGTHQRLPAHPVLGNFVLMTVAHLQIVTEHIGVTHLERRNSRTLAFTLLNLE